MSGYRESKLFVRARRACLVFGAAAALCLGGFLGSTRTGVLLMYNSWGVGVCGSCLEVGRDPMARLNSSASPSGPALVIWPSWTDGFASAWRPFRAGNSTASRAMFPLWQPLLFFSVLAAGAHGVLLGTRWADRNSCAKCGYDLASLPRGSERRCPECGLVDPRNALGVPAPI